MDANRVLNIAKKNISKCDHRQHNVVCAIVKKGKIVSLGYNDKRSHQMMGTQKKVHAEVRAVVKAGRKDLHGATAFVLRSNKNGRPGMAKPCPICEKVLRDRGINHVFFTTSDLSIQEIKYS